MKISIDCRMIEASGVGVYLRGILPFLLNSNNNFLLLGNPAALESFKSLTNIEILECNIKTFSPGELFFFPSSLLKKINSTSLFFTPFFNIPGGLKIPVFITIHDLAFHDVPNLVSKAGLAARKFFYRRAYNRAKKIFTVSDFSRSRILHHLGSKKQVIVTYSAIQSFILKGRGSFSTVKKQKNVVFIGNIKKHKGLNILLDAFLKAKERGLEYKLLIIGEKNNFRTSDKEVMQKIESIDSNDILFTGSISPDSLVKLLFEASLLVQPSLYEGFGLPPLEAMVLGTSALISDIPVFREIYDGDFKFPVYFFKSADVDELSNKLIELLHNKEPPTTQLSSAQLSLYSFEKTAKIILDEINREEY